MDETTARTLLAEQLTGTPPPTELTVDRIVEIAHRRRRTRTRWVAAAAAGLALLVTVGVALVAGGLGDDRLGPTAGAPAPLTPTAPLATVAPSKFDPLETRLVAGWLPADIKFTLRKFTAHDETMWAARADSSPSAIVAVESRGHPEVTALETTGTTVSAGPRINGVPSHWYTYLPVGKHAREGQLRWEWAPGAIAAVKVNGYPDPEQVATRIAQTMRVTIGSPVRLPFTVQAPPGLPVTNTGVRPQAASVAFSHDEGIDSYPQTGPAIELTVEPNTQRGISFQQSTVLNGRPAQIIHDGDSAQARVMYPHAFAEIEGTANPKIGVTTAGIVDLCLRIARSLRLVGNIGDQSTWMSAPPR